MTNKTLQICLNDYGSLILRAFGEKSAIALLAVQAELVLHAKTQEGYFLYDKMEGKLTVICVK